MIYEDKQLLRSCIIAENRGQRPMIGKQTKECPFCLGNENYIDHVYFEEKSPDGHFYVKIINNLYPVCDPKISLYGKHDVVIDTPYHTEHPKDFSIKHWGVLLLTMQKRWKQLQADPPIKFIQIFKNYGPRAGASIAHSHWQIIALGKAPYAVQLQTESMNKYYTLHRKCYLCEMIETLEDDYKIFEDEEWIVIAPPVSEYGYETWLIPKVHHIHYGELSESELLSCGELLKKVIQIQFTLKEESDFNICFMSGPLDLEEHYHFYIKIISRAATLGGFELATNCYINTIHPKIHAREMANRLK